MALTGFRCAVCGTSLLEGQDTCSNGHKQTATAQMASLIIATGEAQIKYLESRKSEREEKQRP